MSAAMSMTGAPGDSWPHPRLRPIPHPLAPHTRPQPAGPPRRLPPDPAITHDPQGDALPGIDDISGYYADLVEWSPCPCDPWDMWGWSSVIFLVHYFAPEYLGIQEADWHHLVRSTDAHTAASTLIYLGWRLDAPPPPPGVPQLLEDIRQAFNSPCQASNPYVRAVNTIRNAIDRKIVASLPGGGPIFLSPLKLPRLQDIRAIWPPSGYRNRLSRVPSLRRYADCDHPDWPLIFNAGERVARERLLIRPETWARAESAIGPQLTAIAALAVFSEQTPAPATERFLDLVQREYSRPGYLRNGLRPRRSILPRPPLGQPRTKC